jgi:hypothetical protein
MDTIDCRSILEHQAEHANFYQLNALVKATREHLNSFGENQGHIRLRSFEISEQLTTPLHYLDDLFTSLFQETETKLNEHQGKYLLMCKRAIVRFYCYIQYFIQQNIDNDKTKFPVDSNQQARKMAHEFYYNATYELRNPYFLLYGFSQSQMTELESTNWREYLKQIYTSPIVPENQDKVSEISYWIVELGKFIEDLPRLWREAEDNAG